MTRQHRWWLPGVLVLLVPGCTYQPLRLSALAPADATAGDVVGGDGTLPGDGPAVVRAAELVFKEAPATPSALGRTLSVVVAIRDGDRQLVTSGPDSTATITLSLGTGTLTGITSVPTVAGVADFRGLDLKVTDVGLDYRLTATKADTQAAGGAGVLVVASRPFDVVAPRPAWMGAAAIGHSAFTPGLGAGSGPGDGMFFGPAGIASDGAHLYVADRANHRVVRIGIAFADIAWLGQVLTPPTGPVGATGCLGLEPGDFTPAWCTGGSAGVSWDPGPLAGPTGIFVSDDHVYVTDSASGTVQRFDKLTGARAGWIGKAVTPPTGAGAGNTSTSCPNTTDVVTPGWCVGGRGGWGKLDGELANPSGIWADALYLYVVDTGNNRINRYLLLEGWFKGWIGRQANTHAPVPGWFAGGYATSEAGPGDGELSLGELAGVTGFGSYLYVTDSGNGRICRFTVDTGAFAGWIGRVGVSPTGGDAGCLGAAAGSFTTGWCRGGESEGSSMTPPGAMVRPTGIVVVSSSMLYVADETRLLRYILSNGTFYGWLGRVGAQTPTMTPCSGLTAGTFTGQWCMDGTASPGTGDGMFLDAHALAITSPHMYVTDSASHRVLRYGLTAPEFFGALGATAAATNAWMTSGVPGGGYDDGIMAASGGILTDGRDLYVHDAARVQKYDLSTATPLGWIGAVSEDLPTGGTGCVGLAAYAPTPGWCRGGRATANWNVPGGLRDGVGAQTQALAFDGTSLYVGNTGMINRYTAATGAFVQAIETGGDLVPVDGLYYFNGYLYEADGYRLQKIRIQDGQIEGWLGRISVAPTGGVAGCSTTEPGSVTPGWCLGGVAKLAADPTTTDGSLMDVAGITGDEHNLYVADRVMAQVLRYDLATGEFRGWTGGVGSVSPTGPAPGGPSSCSGTTTGHPTPGWCFGGTSQAGQAPGSLSGATAIYTDGVMVYVGSGLLDPTRIVRFNAATGAFAGWQGRIRIPADGADPTCAGAQVNQATPGWCMTGEAQWAGDGNGMLNSAYGITGSGDFIFVADDGNHRVMRLPK
jgi:hypothetical protein